MQSNDMSTGRRGGDHKYGTWAAAGARGLGMALALPVVGGEWSPGFALSRALCSAPCLLPSLPLQLQPRTAPRLSPPLPPPTSYLPPRIAPHPSPDLAPARSPPLPHHSPARLAALDVARTRNQSRGGSRGLMGGSPAAGSNRARSPDLPARRGGGGAAGGGGGPGGGPRITSLTSLITSMDLSENPLGLNGVRAIADLLDPTLTPYQVGCVGFWGGGRVGRHGSFAGKLCGAWL